MSASAGEPYKERLLRLPAFLSKGRQGPATPEDVIAGLELTGHFLEARALGPRGDTLPEARLRFRDSSPSAGPPPKLPAAPTSPLPEGEVVSSA